jgi:hypothetical protein
VCAPGAAVIGKQPGPCPALEASKEKPNRWVCGIVASPARYSPIKAALHTEAALSEAFALLVGAGQCCDAIGPGEKPAQSMIAYVRGKVARTPTLRIRWARQLWGI